MKNILRKFIVLFSLGFVLFGFNFANAVVEEIPIPLECTAPQILNEAGDACVDVVVEPLICVLPQVPNDVGDACVDLIPEVIACTELQALVDGVCIDQIVEPTSDPVTIHLEIISGTNSLYDNDILVTACDSDNNPETPDTISAYCSILQSGLISDWSWYGDGAFVNSIGSIAGYTSKDSEGSDVYHYWSWFLNGNYGETGLNQYELISNDLILLEFIDPKTEATPETNNGGGSGGGNTTPDKTFSIKNALSFLYSQQQTNGSFGSSLYTDWVAIATSKAGSDAGELNTKLRDYLKNENFEASNITDYERHAMALMALGIDPYSRTDINYIKNITDSFDGTQIGDKNLFNDDIFGLIVLQNAGYGKNDEIIDKTISYVIEKQSSNGSWGSIDMTGAGIMALKDFENVDGVGEAISKAENYLVEKQNEDGGFDNSFSTSWATQAFSLNNSFDQNVNDAIEYLTNEQQDDGGLIGSDMNNRIWATSYAIPAFLEMSWNDILEDFEKVVEEVEQSGSQSQNENITQSGGASNSIIILATQEVVTPLEIKEEPVKIAKAQENPIKKEIITPKTEPIIEEIIDDSLLEEGNIVNDNDLLASAGNANISGFLKDKIIILTIISVIIVLAGGWLTNRYIV